MGSLRVVCTSDTHFPFDQSMIPSGDVFLHAGDLMYTGYEKEWLPRLLSLSTLDHKYKIITAGNHDIHMDLYGGPSRQELRQAGYFCFDGQFALTQVKGGLNVFGIPWVSGLRGWGFGKTEEELSEWLGQALCFFDRREISPDIIVSHMPVYGILDFENEMNLGSGALLDFFNSLSKKPKLWVHGHIHEGYGQTNVDGTQFVNAAMCDRDYKQTNKPIVIDLEI